MNTVHTILLAEEYGPGTLDVFQYEMYADICGDSVKNRSQTTMDGSKMQ